MLERKRRVLKDRTDANRKLFLAALALPKLTRGEERVFAALAERAEHAIGPAEIDRERKSVVLIGEELDGFLQRFRKVWRLGVAHGPNVGPESGCVKYISTSRNPVRITSYWG